MVPLEKYMMASRARLVDYEIYLSDFFLVAYSSVEYSSFYEGATETSEMARLIHANLLEGLILLGGDRKKFERCFLTEGFAKFFSIEYSLMNLKISCLFFFDIGALDILSLICSITLS